MFNAKKKKKILGGNKAYAIRVDLFLIFMQNAKGLKGRALYDELSSKKHRCRNAGLGD